MDVIVIDAGLTMMAASCYRHIDYTAEQKHRHDTNRRDLTEGRRKNDNLYFL